MKIQNLFLLGASLVSPALYPVVVKELPQTVKVKAYDRASGKLFLGMSVGAEKESLMMFPRFDGGNAIASAGIATDDLLKNQIIEFLALSEQGCDASSLLATVTKAADFYQQTRVIGLTADGTTVVESEELNDAAGAAVTKGIVGIAASKNNVFAAVRPIGDVNYGDANSGIALLEINTSPASLTPLDATTGNSGNRAQQFDQTSATLGFSPPVTFDATITNENIVLYFDTSLNRLYLGTKITAGNGGARSTAVGVVNETTGALTIDQVTSNSTLTGADNSHIIVTSNAVTAEVYKLAVMHASTGPSYLIVNGEVDVDTNNKNNIYALPLVDNPTAADHGTLAKKDSPLTNGKFTVAASAAGDLVANDAAEAMVGAGPLPIADNHVPADLVVVGDTVYASIDDAFGPTSESGIFYSQALFDQTGKIVSWTPWTKRATPFNSFPEGATEHAPTSFFAVDAMNGKIWAVNASTEAPATTPGKKLMTTSWDKGSDVGQTAPKTLAGALNKELSAGCYSILDLDQSTNGFDAATSCTARYALFGGVDKVVVSLISIAHPALPYSQILINNFSAPETFRSFPLPSGAGAVTALEYSRRNKNKFFQNYFFAGTQAGLFVLADSDEKGFTIDNTVEFLNAAPFTNLQWHKLDTTKIEGSVIALKTTGQGLNGALYILTLEATNDATQPLVSRLYRMPYQIDLQSMVTNTKLIAQSNVNDTNSDLSKASIILGMQTIIPANGNEQLVIATNNGLYRSQSTLAEGILQAESQADAQWTPVDATDTALYTGLFGIDNATNTDNFPSQTTVWAPQVADEAGLKTYARGMIRQLSRKITTDNYAFSPKNFNSSDPAAANATTLPQITSFWTDGARRFFVCKRSGDYYNRNRLMVFPFDQSEWCTSPLYVSDPIFSNVCSCNCIKHIGATGILMVGTDSGVIALE